MVTHPAGEQVDDGVVGVDPGAAGDAHQRASECQDGFVVFLGRGHDLGVIGTAVPMVGTHGHTCPP